MKEIPSAEDFVIQHRLGQDNPRLEQHIAHTLKEFAKLHCERLAEVIAENASAKFIYGSPDIIEDCEVDKESILNAYPLENIK